MAIPHSQDGSNVHTIDTLLRLAALPFPPSATVDTAGRVDPAAHPLMAPTALPAHAHLAREGDASGYTLLHAVVSYGHASLIPVLVAPPYGIDVNVRDDDGETPLFAAETVECATELVRGCGANWRLQNLEGVTAEENARVNAEDANDGDAPEEASRWAGVAEYLKELRQSEQGQSNNSTVPASLPPLPPNVQMRLEHQLSGQPEIDSATASAALAQDTQLTDATAQPDPEFAARIAALAQRPDFQSEAGQQELRTLIEDVVGQLDERERAAYLERTQVNGDGPEAKRRRGD